MSNWLRCKVGKNEIGYSVVVQIKGKLLAGWDLLVVRRVDNSSLGGYGQGQHSYSCSPGGKGIHVELLVD